MIFMARTKAYQGLAFSQVNVIMLLLSSELMKLHKVGRRRSGWYRQPLACIAFLADTCCDVEAKDRNSGSGLNKGYNKF